MRPSLLDATARLNYCARLTVVVSQGAQGTVTQNQDSGEVLREPLMSLLKSASQLS